MFTFAIDYFLLSAVATIGVIQIGATLGKLDGLMLVKSYLLARVFGLALVFGAFVWFFSTGERNINDYEGGLDANAQALYFFLGVAAGGVATLLLSSALNWRMRAKDYVPGAGFESLKRSSHFNALVESLRYWWNNWRSQMKNYFSG